MVEKISDRFGNYLDFNYKNTLLNTVRVNHPQRVVTFQHDSENRIIAITDFTGRAWKYRYDDYGDLISVTTPSLPEHKKGLATVYEYSSPNHSTFSLQHNLVSIWDASGQLFLENEYGTEANLLSFNRIIRQRQGSGEMFLEYENVVEDFTIPYALHQEPSKQTIVTGRDGHQVRYLFNRYGNMVYRESYVRVNGGIPRLVGTHFRYNRDGKLIGTMSPEGIVAQYLYCRDVYERNHPVDEDYVPTEDPTLDAQMRQSFHQLIATVKRGKYYNTVLPNLMSGLWSSDIFPDVFGASDEDLIQKQTYEPVFGQILTISDPRYTRSANPAFPEDPAYFSHLTRYAYHANGSIQHFILSGINHSAVTAPDGSLIGTPENKFLEYDTKSRLLKSVDAAGLVTQIEYYDHSSGLLEGMRKTTILDPEGFQVKTENELDTLGRKIKIHAPASFESMDGRYVTTAEYNALGQMTKTISSLPFQTAISRKFDKTGNVIEQVTEVKNSAIELQEDLTVKNCYVYDEESNLIQVLESDMQNRSLRTNKFIYDRAARLSLTISAQGRKSKWVYDERSLTHKEIADYGGLNVYSKKYYDADGRIIRSIDARRGVYRTTYDTFGRPIESEDPYGNRTYTTFDKLGNLLIERFFGWNANGFELLRRSQFEYDELGRLNKKSENLFDYTGELVLDPEVAYLNFGLGRLLQELVFYDIAGRIIKTIDQSNNESITFYDVLGRVVEESDAIGNTMHHTYDTSGNLIRTDNTELIRDSNNTITGRRCFASMQMYDELNRVVERIDSLGNKTKYSYDSRGLLESQTDAGGNVSSLVYDTFGRLTSKSLLTQEAANPVSGVPVVTAYEYDRDNILLSQTDALNRRSVFQSNGLGIKYSTTLPDGRSDHSEFDFGGLVAKYTDRNGLKTQFTRDLFGRIIRQEMDASLAISPTEGSNRAAFDFDALGRIIVSENEFCRYRYQYNSLGWLTEENINIQPVLPGSAMNLTLGRAYHDSGAMSLLTYPSGRQLEYNRDLLGRLVSIAQKNRGANYPGETGGAQQYTLQEIRYEGMSRKQLTGSNGSSTELMYDVGERVTEIKHSFGTNAFLHIQMLYDAMGNMRQKTELSADFQSTATYEYDPLYQLKQLSRSNAIILDLSSLQPFQNTLPWSIPNTQSVIDGMIINAVPDLLYDYDPVGNRQTISDNGTVLSQYVVNSLDQYEQVDNREFEYDRNGNLRSDDEFKYIYDFANRLTAIESKVNNTRITSFFYDTLGRRIIEMTAAGPRQFIYASMHLIEEYHNQPSNLVQSLVWDMDSDNLLQLARDGKDFSVYTDLTNSVRYLYRDQDKETFYQFDEFGKLLLHGNDTIHNLFLFQSRKLIEPIGKYDFFTRVYDPETGRFQQRDRQAYVDGTNLYSFLGNNPLTYTDPFGQGREESNNVKYIQIKGNADGWRPNNHESGVLGFFYTAFVGGRGANGDRRYRLLTPDQQIARGLMDKQFGCTLCHLSTEIWNRYGPAAFNPENNLPYDWAINKQGLQDWEDMSARARFFVEGMTMIGTAKVNSDRFFANYYSKPNVIQTGVYEVSKVQTEVELLRKMAQQPLTRMDKRLYYNSLPEVVFTYNAKMAADPGDANFQRFGYEWAQHGFEPLIRGQRHALDDAVRARARNFMDRSGFNRTGRQAMHPLDSASNRFIDPNGTIGSTYYFGNKSVNLSFGGQLGNQFQSLGIRPGQQYRASFRSFPDYSVAPPRTPPSSPPNL